MPTDIRIVWIESLKRFVRDAMYYSEDVHRQVFEHENIPAAIAYLQKASSKMASAEALYYAQYDELARDEVEAIFHQFDVFSDELIQDFATDHSQQWTDIEFDRFKDLFDNSACAFEPEH